MNSMKNIKIEDIIGVWECNDYSLVITKKCVLLTDKKMNVITLEEPVSIEYIANENNKSTFNTVRLSQNIYIYQLITDDNLYFTIKNENIEFNRLGFINEFKFYRNTEIPSKRIAIRWYSPWEYIAMIEFQDLSITKILTGKIEKQRTEIINTYEEAIFPKKWTEISFKDSFPYHKQNEIIEYIKHQLL
ncbi:hypothetical protein [Bacteroides sp.]|uniref:hypothetical protein n=1 Tax=Bacteroides sp. TaxID=29523 RepID=UPI00262E3A9D|nr:hypothetical protein [Bacteroides sp.]MDD3038642.1 hypothetical protein [Bacteroides sp.]